MTVDAITDTTIAISWSQGPTDNINDYVVVYHYTGTCTGLGFRRFFLDGSARNHVQHDLRPGSRYLVVVAARNGAGIESSEMNVSTAFASKLLPGVDPGIRKRGVYHTHFPKTTPLMTRLRGGAHILGSI